MNSSYCFIAGTLVLTVLGLLPIEEIEAGMQVYSTEENTGETEIKEVVQTFVNQTYELVHVKLEDGEEIICTPSHPFYTDKGWIDAGKLTEDSLLVDEEGNYIGISSLVTEYLEEPVKVYNFEVEDYHTYYVGDDIILAHNSCNHKSEWAKERRHFWKDFGKTVEPNHDYESFVATDMNINRMLQGKAPIGWDGYSVQLHHW